MFMQGSFKATKRVFLSEIKDYVRCHNMLRKRYNKDACESMWSDIWHTTQHSLIYFTGINTLAQWPIRIKVSAY